MRFLITALVGFLVLPVGVIAPNTAEAAQTALTPGMGIEALVAPNVSAKVAAPVPFTAKLTAYNAVPGQTDATPFVTAAGAFSNPEVVAARSGDLAAKLPYGTIIKIERTQADSPACRFSSVEDQVGYRVIADAMNPRISNTVDLLLNQNKKVWVDGRLVNPAYAVGRCDAVSVTIVGKMSVSAIPMTQAELVTMVEGPKTVAIR
jgi:3D (Asp-Asp-Asp) domain-containing protein